MGQLFTDRRVEKASKRPRTRWRAGRGPSGEQSPGQEAEDFISFWVCRTLETAPMPSPCGDFPSQASS